VAGKTTGAPGGRRHPILRGLLLLIVVVIVIAALTGGKKGGSSSTKHQGPWARLVSCMEGHPLFNVYDAYSASAATATAASKAVSIWQTLKGVPLAYVGNNALGADDNTGAGDANVDQKAGSIHYGFTPQADAQNQADITGCIVASY
jgi:hypothetical protein